MFEKKNATFKSPDLEKLQAVVIDVKTIIYIAIGDNPEKARSRYFARLQEKKQ